LWNVKEQACIHAFNPRRGMICSLFLAGGTGISCIAVANFGSIIRLWKAEGSSDFASEINDGHITPGGSVLGAAFSTSESFLATASYSSIEMASTLDLYELETMTKTQSVVMPGVNATCFALSPDSRQLFVGDYYTGSIRLVQTDDFSIQRDLDTRGELENVAFDPTGRVLAYGCRDGTLELRAL
jgi:WD40 repeat protein